MSQPDPTTTPSVSRSPENSIRPARRRHPVASVPAANAPHREKSAQKPALAVPEEVRRRFVQVKNRYFFPDGARAFTDRGTRLTTQSENTEVVRSLLLIAEARGWREVTVRGTERFRREAWFAGQLAGIEVRGYKPSEFERGRLIRRLNRPGPALTEDSISAGDKPAPREPGRRVRRRDELLTGRLIDHGPAPYRHDPHESMSYFVKLETSRGERTIWGVDLERAFKESLTKPQAGAEVGIRAVRQESVKVRTQKRDPKGKLIEGNLDTHRNRWIIEERRLFDARAEAAQTLLDTSITPKQAVTQHPELVGTYLQVHAAELAAKRFRDTQDRARFVETVRSALAESVARGEPLPAVRLRERAEARAPHRPEREPAPVRG
jgi:Large polyvalent protein-associated domain 7